MFNTDNLINNSGFQPNIFFSFILTTHSRWWETASRLVTSISHTQKKGHFSMWHSKIYEISQKNSCRL